MLQSIDVFIRACPLKQDGNVLPMRYAVNHPVSKNKMTNQLQMVNNQMETEVTITT